MPIWWTDHSHFTLFNIIMGPEIQVAWITHPMQTKTTWKRQLAYVRIALNSVCGPSVCSAVIRGENACSARMCTFTGICTHYLRGRSPYFAGLWPCIVTLRCISYYLNQDILSIDRYKIRYKFKILAVKAVKCFIITMIKLHFWDIGGNGWHTVFKSNPTDVSDVWLLKLIFSAAKIKQLIN